VSGVEERAGTSTERTVGMKALALLVVMAAALAATTALARADTGGLSISTNTTSRRISTVRS
jgi:hypothetical protein